MKKFLAILLALIVCVAFTACGSDNSSSKDSGDSKEASEEQAEETEDDSEGTDEESSEGAVEEAAFEEIVLFDTDDVTMKITKYDPNSMWGFSLKVYIENKTENTIMFAVEDASVNGFMLDPFWASEIAPGKKENTEITWFSEALEENGIESVEDIDLQIRVYDSDDWEAAPLIEDTYTINIPQ